MVYKIWLNKLFYNHYQIVNFYYMEIKNQKYTIKKNLEQQTYMIQNNNKILDLSNVMKL